MASERSASSAPFVTANILTSGGPNSAPAPNADADLLNPWGLAYAPTGPFRVDETVAGRSEKFDASGLNNGLPGANVITFAPTNSGRGANRGMDLKLR